MTCPRCSFENPEGMHFCGKCGCRLSILPEQPTTTPTPEEKLKRIQRYLPEGLAERILSQKDRIEGERRQVTIMFCDMKGFTPLTERLGPEETFTLMDKVFEILIHKVNEFGGTVNEIRGDGILAVFGALDALEDAPHRAVRSAVEIHKEVAEFSRNLLGNSRIGPILLRIGINTGPVVIGTVGNDLRVQFTVMGDTINMASRMETLAEPGTTYVTEETYRLTKDLFHFMPLGMKAVKGKDDPIPVYRLLSTRTDVLRPRPGSERRIYTEMVGRDVDLNRLELQVVKVIDGRGSVVNVIGEAGIGKSRLLAELKRREVMNRVTLLEGRAISIGRNLSFHPVTELLKQWAEISIDDMEAEAFDKLQAAVRKLLPEEYEEVLPFVATLMGMKLSGRHAERVGGITGEPLKGLITKSMRELVSKATEVNPLVIVAEDLHWADTSSLELMESLFPLAETHRVVFLNLFRPGYEETGDRIVKSLKEPGRVYHVEIVLEPLSRRLSEELVMNMLGISGFQYTIIASIAERTGGNPFFIEEVARSLIDEGAIEPKNGLVQLTERVAEIQIPPTVEDVLMARIDRLEEESRGLVKIASVIGRTFFYRILLEVAPNVDGIDSRLSHLEEIQILRKGFRMGEVEYLFNHALVQEVAYRSILLTRLKDLHLKAARAIEKIFDERLHEFYGMLAYHYSRGESLEKAEEYLIKAGEEALRSSASNEALYYYQEALRVYLKSRGDEADPEKVAMLEKNIGLALFNRGHYAEAVDHFDKSLDYYWDELPKNSISMTIKFLFSFTTFIFALYFPSLWFKRIATMQEAESLALLYKKGEALAVIDPKRFFVECFFFYYTLVHFDLTKFNLGIGFLVAASSLFSFTGLSFSIGRRILDYAKPKLAPDNAKQLIVYDLMDTQHRFLNGRWNEITECNEDLVMRNLKIGEMFYASHHYYWHGLPELYQGNFDQAGSFVTKLNEIAETYDNDIYRLLKYLLSIQLLIECRQLTYAAEEVNRGIDLVQKKSWRLSGLTMHSLKASIHLQMKEMEEAKKSLDLASQIRSEVKAVPLQLSFFYRSQFEYDVRRLEEAFANGLKNEASKHLKNADTSGKMLMKTCRKAALYRTESCRLMGVYNWLISDRKSALKWWQKAVSEGENLRVRPHLSRVHYEIGKRLSCIEGADPESIHGRAREHLVSAEKMFREMGLRQDLQELVALFGKLE